MIDWKKKGQIVNVGWSSNIETPFWGGGSIHFYVDENGNFFGCDEEPKYNPITGSKIESVNYLFAENDYEEDEEGE